MASYLLILIRYLLVAGKEFIKKNIQTNIVFSNYLKFIYKKKKQLISRAYFFVFKKIEFEKYEVSN
jgi:hypothetical protein